MSHYTSHYHYPSQSIAFSGQQECWTQWSQPVNCINIGWNVKLLSGPTVHSLYCGIGEASCKWDATLSKTCITALRQSLQKVVPDYILLRAMFLAAKMLRLGMIGRHVSPCNFVTIESKTHNSFSIPMIKTMVMEYLGLCYAQYIYTNLKQMLLVWVTTQNGVQLMIKS